jgi:hypothetical protein
MHQSALGFPRAGWAAGLLCTAMLLSGCSAGSGDRGTVEPSAAAADPCLLLSSEEVGSALTDQFRSAPADRNNLANSMQCIYTTTTSDPAGLVITSISLAPGRAAFDTGRGKASGYYGGPVADTQIDGADQAYVVIERDFRAPVIGMLVGEQFVELQVSVTGASVDQARELAERVASRLN